MLLLNVSPDGILDAFLPRRWAGHGRSLKEVVMGCAASAHITPRLSESPGPTCLPTFFLQFSIPQH